MKLHIAKLVTLLVFSGLSTTFADKLTKDDWPWWRGPNSNGTAIAGQKPPLRWSERENIRWRTPVPGRGHSSPTIVGDLIFLTSADEANQIQGVFAFNRETGKEAWRAKISEGGFPETHPKNTHATPSVACNGDQLFAVFHHHDALELVSLDLKGKKLWSKKAGAYTPQVYKYGYAPSPLLYHNSVIVAADYDGKSYIKAFTQANGKALWSVPRPGKLSFSSPIIAELAGKDQLLLSGNDLVASYDPKSGKRNWATPGTTMATCGTLVWSPDNNLVFASGGYPKPETVCVKADGSGVVWKNRQKCYEQSMLAVDGYLYAVTDQGVAYCWKADDGQQMWVERLRGPVSASPVFAGGHIYAANERGAMYVFKADPNQFQSVAQNQLGDEAFATAAFCHDEIYIRVAHNINGRRQEYLYCISSSR